MQRGQQISRNLQKTVAQMNSARRRADPIGTAFGDAWKNIKKSKLISNTAGDIAGALAGLIPQVGPAISGQAKDLVGSVLGNFGLGRRRRGGRRKARTGGKKKTGGRKRRAGGRKRKMAKRKKTGGKRSVRSYMVKNLGTGRRRRGGLLIAPARALVQGTGPLYRKKFAIGI